MSMRSHLVAPHELDLGSVKAGGVVRGKIRVANNGTGLLTGSVRAAPSAAWLQLLGTGEVFCAAGAVESVEVQARVAGLKAGAHSGTIQLDSDGGQASIRVSVVVVRDTMVPAVAAGVITAVVFLVVASILYSSNGGKLPFLAAAATPAPTRTATANPSPTLASTPVSIRTAVPSATSVDLAATATSEAQQANLAQQLVAAARATATALSANLDATATALAVSQAPGTTDQRVAIQNAVNDFLLVRSQALFTTDGSKLPGVASGNELRGLDQSISALIRDGEHTQILSIEEPVWDSIVLSTTDVNQADATLTKHEDELAIRNSTGQPDDQDPSYKGTQHTLRNQLFAVSYHMQRTEGSWLVDDATVIEHPQPLPTPDSSLLPPPIQLAPAGQGTATPVATASPQSNQLTVEQVVRLALPSILRITGNIANDEQSTGTGFVVQTSGDFAYVVTNDHVVNGATDVTLSDQAGDSIPAISEQEDIADDLAVIKIAQPPAALPALSWGDSGAAQLGENVVAIGYALGLEGDPTVTTGIISALHRTNVQGRWPLFQHTAPINPGNSGGPLLDMQGNVIGINTLLDENAQLIYFAIPSTPASQKVADLIGAMP